MSAIRPGHTALRAFALALVALGGARPHATAALEPVASTSYVMPGAPGLLANLGMPVALGDDRVAFVADLVDERDTQVVATSGPGGLAFVRPRDIDAAPGDLRPFLALTASGGGPLVAVRNVAAGPSRISIVQLGAQPAVLVPDVLAATHQSANAWGISAWSAQPGGFALQSSYSPGRLGFVPFSSTISLYGGGELVPLVATRSEEPPFIAFVAPVLSADRRTVTFGGILSSAMNVPTSGIYAWEDGIRRTLVDPSARHEGTPVAIVSFGVADDGAIAASDAAGNRIVLWESGRFTTLAGDGARTADGTAFEMRYPEPAAQILRVDRTHVYFTGVRHGTGPLGFAATRTDFIFRVARTGGSPELYFDPRRVFADLSKIELTRFSLTRDTPRLTFLVRESFGSQQAIFTGAAPFGSAPFPAVPAGYPRVYLQDPGSGFSTNAGTPRELEVAPVGTASEVHSFAWSLDGVPLSAGTLQYAGTAAATLRLTPFGQKYHSGRYTVAVTSSAGTTYASATVVVDAYYQDGNGSLPALVNTSARAFTADDDGVFTAGITLLPPLTAIQWTPSETTYSWLPNTSQRILIRAVGPGLAPFAREEVVPAPETRLDLFSGQTPLARNAGAWDADANVPGAAAAVGAFPLAPGSRDSALLLDLAPQPYTAQLAAPAGNGTALLEFYVAGGRGNVRNLSARGRVTDAEPHSLTLGFVIRRSPGSLPARAILLRAAGPSLAPYGIANPASHLQLELYSADQVLLARNSAHDMAPNSADIAEASRLYGAFPFAPASSDAALLLHLPEGAYVARVAAAPGSNGGVALLELYTQIGFALEP